MAKLKKMISERRINLSNFTWSQGKLVMQVTIG